MNTIVLFVSFLFYWAISCICSIFCVSQKLRNGLAAIIPCLYLTFLAFEFEVFVPWQRLFVGTIGLLYTIKTIILLLSSQAELSKFSKIGLFVYMSIWPGMDLDPFRCKSICMESGRRFVHGYVCFWLGLACLIASSTFSVPQTFGNWLCLIGLFLMIHFGYADMLTCVIRLIGWNVRPLFDAPLLSNSLQDFWSRRWNIAFVEMDKILFWPLMRQILKPQAAIFAVFLISGLLHEIGISYASGQLWGLPSLYFLIQAGGMILEKKLFKTSSANMASRVFTILWIILPLFLLFNGAFLSTFIVPLRASVAHLEFKIMASQPLSQALWLAGIGHFCTLIAGLQVPFRLNWKEELSRLSSFNRKIMLNYALYVGLTIVAFGWLTFALHNEFLSGEKAAIYLALMIALFWILRLVIDCVYFKHSDWPQGPELVIGHALLNTLFLFLALTYSCVVISQWLPIQMLR